MGLKLISLHHEVCYRYLKVMSMTLLHSFVLYSWVGFAMAKIPQPDDFKERQGKWNIASPDVVRSASRDSSAIWLDTRPAIFLDSEPISHAFVSIPMTSIDEHDFASEAAKK